MYASFEEVFFTHCMCYISHLLIHEFLFGTSQYKVMFYFITLLFYELYETLKFLPSFLKAISLNLSNQGVSTPCSRQKQASRPETRHIAASAPGASSIQRFRANTKLIPRVLLVSPSSFSFEERQALSEAVSSDSASPWSLRHLTVTIKS